MEYHAVVALCFDTFAFVIDHTLHPTAIKIPLEGEFYVSPYVPLFGPPGQMRFRYSCEDGENKLTMDNGSQQKAPTFGPLFFSEMDVVAATNQLAILAAMEMQPVKGQQHILMPPRKYVSVRSKFAEEPQFIAATPVKDEHHTTKWLATTVRVQVDFANPMLTKQIPMNDWVMKPREGQNCLTHLTRKRHIELDAKKYNAPYFELPELAILW